MEGTIAKTRDKLIEVARLLFAKIGVENTTMNDIAVASHKGRRTLYTYFKNKEEIYQAVVESELGIMYNSLETVVSKNIPADEKLLEFIHIRLESIKEAVFRNGTLRAYFFRDIWQVENVRRPFDVREMKYLQRILEDGVQEELFYLRDVKEMSIVLHHAFRGLEVPYIRGFIAGTDNIINLLFNGIKKKNN